MSSDHNDFNFSLDSESGNKRQAFRAEIPGLMLLVHDRKTGYAVKDLSALGVAFVDPSPGSFRSGELHSCQLLLGEELFLTDLTIEVVHVLDSGMVGCNFHDLDQRQEIALDKFILEVQKELITLRKRQEG